MCTTWLTLLDSSRAMIVHDTEDVRDVADTAADSVDGSADDSAFLITSWRFLETIGIILETSTCICKRLENPWQVWEMFGNLLDTFENVWKLLGKLWNRLEASWKILERLAKCGKLRQQTGVNAIFLALFVTSRS